MYELITLNALLKELPGVSYVNSGKVLSELFDRKVKKNEKLNVLGIEITSEELKEIYHKIILGNPRIINGNSKKEISPRGAKLIYDLYKQGKLEFKKGAAASEPTAIFMEYMNHGHNFTEYKAACLEEARLEYAGAKEEDFDYAFLHRAFYRLQADAVKEAAGEMEGNYYYLTIGGIKVTQQIRPPFKPHNSTKPYFPVSFYWKTPDGEHKEAHSPLQ